MELFKSWTPDDRSADTYPTIVRRCLGARGLHSGAQALLLGLRIAFLSLVTKLVMVRGFHVYKRSKKR